MNYSHPIGTIYETTSSALNTVAKMNAHFGGTWEVYGSGRTTVAISSDTEFNTIDKESGAKTHALAKAEMATNVPIASRVATGDYGLPIIGSYANRVYVTTSTGVSPTTGSGTAHNNIQPSITVYRYRRTA